MSGAERTGPVGTGQVRPLGLILAGGHASRLGGGDKTLLAVGGRTILERIVERLGPQCDGLVLSANGPPDRFPGWAGPVVPDHPDDAGKGPLAGLLAGLDWAAAKRPDLAVVLTVSADTPFLPRDLADRLAVARAAEADTIAFARSAGREHPLVALWPTAFRTRLRQGLRREGLRRVRDALQLLAPVAVDWPVDPVDPFFNVNTPAELDLAERLAPAC